MGRPSDFSQEIADTICAKLAEPRSLRSICQDEGMPDKATVFRWLEAHPAFRDQYARGRVFQAESIFDEALDIADDGSNDYVTKTNGDGSTYQQVNTEHIQRSRLRIDTRKWMAGKLAPKKYGEKIALTGSDGSGPVQIEHSGKMAQLDASERAILREMLERRLAAAQGEEPPDGDEG
jgi:hypothetical protein